MMNWYEYTIMAAEHSKNNAAHWFRYLRKMIFEDYLYLNDKNLEKLLASKQLTDFQKVTLKRALDNKTLTHEYVVSLNKKAKLTNLRKVMKKHD